MKKDDSSQEIKHMSFSKMLVNLLANKKRTKDNDSPINKQDHNKKEKRE